MGWSQREMGRVCNIPANMIHRYEKGENDPTTKPLTIIAEVLGVSTDYLLGLTDNPRGQFGDRELTVDEDKILKIYRREGWSGVFHLGADQIAPLTKNHAP